jgi:uncharacterized protein involved in outer membrane biogenesis
MINRNNWRQGWFDPTRLRTWSWLLLALYAVLGFVVAPWLARDAIVDAVQDNLGLVARLADVDVNPFVFSVRLEGFAIDDTGGKPLLAVDSLEANVQLSSIVRRALTFAEIRLTEPVVRFVRTNDTVNLAELIPRGNPDGASTAMPRLIIDRIEIVRGRLEVEDQAVRETFRTTFGPIDVVIDDIATLAERVGDQHVTVIEQSGARIEWSGTLALNPLSSRGHASISRLPVTAASAYLPADLDLAIRDGRVNARLDYVVDASTDGALKLELNGVVFDLEDFAVTPRGGAAEPEPLVALDALHVTGGRLRWPAGEVAIDAVRLDGPTLRLQRDAMGQFNWQRHLATSDVAADKPQQALPADTGPSADWQVSLAEFAIDAGSVRFSDMALTPTASLGIERVRFAARSLSLDAGVQMPFQLDLAIAGGGSVVANGEFGIEPDPTLTASITLQKLNLPMVQPYLNAATLLALTAGDLDIEGKIASDSNEAFAFDGDASVAGLAMVMAADGERFLDWQRLTLDGLRLRTSAREVSVAQGTLDGAFASLRIDPEGQLNAGTLVREPAAAETPVPPPADETDSAPWALRVVRFDVTGAASDFLDESLPIPFRASVSQLNGRLSRIDSTSAEPADVKMEGRVGEYGLVRLNGALAPLEVARNTRLDAHFENIEIKDATPYAIRFAGWEIDRGKLDLDTQYTIRDGRLRAKHEIVLREFALGKRVAYPGALDLPLGFAVSLLKGPDGNIDLELPIEGDVDDPEFRIGGVVAAALGKLIGNLVAAPFKLLGALVGLGGESAIDSVAFLPGRADLAPPEREKIAKLAEALTLRPGLDVGVPAVVAPSADGLALRQAQVAARIDARQAGGDQTALRSTLEVLAQGIVGAEVQRALQAQFTQAGTDATPASFDELAYIAALEQRLIDAEPIAPGALEALAEARRDVVVQALLANQAVDPARVVASPAVEVTAKRGKVALEFSAQTR